MKYPEFLKKGDKIVLTALSAGVAKRDEEKKVRYFKAIDNLKKEGFNILLINNSFSIINFKRFCNFF